MLEYEEGLQEVERGRCASLLEQRENELPDGGVEESEEVETKDKMVIVEIA